MPLSWARRDLPAPVAEEILRERPFAALASIASVEALVESEGHSGRAFVAVAEDGRRFKLRACPSAARAREIDAVMRRLPDVLPRLLAREGRYLLIEFLAGESPGDRKQLRPHARRLGRIYAEVHRRGALGPLRGAMEAARLRLQFARQLRALERRGAIDAALARDARRAWREWRRRHGTAVCLELHDAHKANFMLDDRGELKYVDEEGLRYTLRGMGLGKLLADTGVRPESPKRQLEWADFREGYAEVADAGWLVPGYRDGARLLELVRSVDSKLRSEARLFKVDAELEELRELVSGVKAKEEDADASVVPVRGRGAP